MKSDQFRADCKNYNQKEMFAKRELKESLDTELSIASSKTNRIKL